MAVSMFQDLLIFNETMAKLLPWNWFSKEEKEKSNDKMPTSPIQQ